MRRPSELTMNPMKTIRKNPSFGSPASMRGVGLVEVLVAVLVLAIGLLGIAALQATTLRNSQSSIERTQAVVQTYTILDAMRANLTAARGTSYNMPMTCVAPSAGTLITSDQRFWLLSAQASLGSTACGKIECKANVCTITLQWDDSRSKGGSSAQTLVTVTQL